MSSRSALASLLVGALAVSLPQFSTARVFATVNDALASAFPGCSIERKTVFLTTEQLESARELADVTIPSALVHPYVATCGGEPGGTAYFDAHRVRTLPETLLVVVDPAGEVHRVEVLSFDEPEEYIPRSIWYQQFVGKALDDDLRLARGIDGVTGATLTARATTDAVRRILALHQAVGVAHP